MIIHKICFGVTPETLIRLQRLKARRGYTWKQFLLIAVIRYCKRNIELNDHVALHERDIKQFQNELAASLRK